ncbi:MAG: penicillin-binding protein [Clostridia bacterium]|nr:penicillin-binding protein [Clostridia bacterium]
MRNDRNSRARLQNDKMQQRSRHSNTRSNIKGNNRISREDNIDFRKRKPKKKQIKKQMSPQRKWFIKKFNKLFVIAYLIFSIYVIWSYINWGNTVVPMMKNEHSVVVDASGNVLDTLGSERNTSNVSLSDIPDNLKNAYIDIEDERFYKHKGVDLKRTVGAITTYVTHFGKSSFGGSTITQQLVKNLTGDDDNSVGRKFQEWIRAGELEMLCTKDEILESYLNIIYTAPNTYGVDAGAKYYFDKNVKDLDLAECAFLAGINNSPNSYNPFKEKDNSERIKKRSKTVLKKMLDLNHISQDDYNSAVQEIEDGLKFKNGKPENVSDGVYSYHTDALISELVADVSKNKHIDSKFATNYIYMSGLKIYSTENKSIQDSLEKEYKKEQYVIKSSSTGNTSQSAMVIIDHTNGQVVACVGGLGEKKTSRGFNRATQGFRQTGSASKPLAVLIPGISEKIFTTATMYVDEPTKFDDGSPDGYSPTNNENYIGEITVRRAVESSQNIPFVKMMEQIGPKKSVKYMKKMGITSLQDKDESLMLALGGLEKGITPLEMAAAYATIANDGEYIEPTFYTRVEDGKGKTIIKSKQDKRRVFSEEVAYILKELLKQPVEGASGTARACKIEGMDVAAKTGTTNNNYDKWLCGFTTYYTAVTWYGYDINESIQYKGKSPAVNIWSSVMRNIHSGLSKTRFEQNGKVKQATICASTGKTATSSCSDTYTEYFLSGTVPDQCTSCSSGYKKSKPTTNKNTVNSNQNTVDNSVNTTNTTNTSNSNTVNNTSSNTSTNTTNKNTTDKQNKNTVNNTTNENTNTTQNNTTNKQNNTENNTVNNTVDNTVNTGNDADDDEEQDDGP